jgi:hypothetical protein
MKTTMNLAGEWYTVIREGPYRFYLYTTAEDDDHNEHHPFRTKQQAINRAEELAQTRREANTQQLRAELEAVFGTTNPEN